MYVHVCRNNMGQQNVDILKVGRQILKYLTVTSLFSLKKWNHPFKSFIFYILRTCVPCSTASLGWISSTPIIPSVCVWWVCSAHTKIIVLNCNILIE